ncbi:Hypothetical predicted protein [Olea europaea subsp. europaea]|uniref:Uncharacterized protein n=1 Tax=Olea europaea subsp. europaea TaxID=158383 RepID=A0A8S0PRV3_OLEEU|nr:Hypothetical predicted protein [Olea europaea subsp. europaea]
MADEQPSTVKLEGPDCFSNPKIVICDLEPLESEMVMPYMNGVQYNKPIQSMSSIESQRRTKRRTERSVEDASTSRKSVPSVLPLMDSNIGQAYSSDDDDDFVALPPRQQESSARGKSPVVEGKTNKMDDIIQIQACIKSDLMDIQTNMQFLSESVSIMISNAMDEIIRRSGDWTSEHGGSLTAEPTSELPVKRILRPSRVLQSSFVTGQERGKLLKHDDNVVIFEDYKDNVDEINKSAFMGWF